MASLILSPEPSAEVPVAVARRLELLRRRYDALALCGLGALLCVLLVASWGRWTQPVVDHGREMNVPARILAGERLYADVQYLYGPLAPNLNAMLYRLFGTRLSTLYGAGIACAFLLLGLIYRIARGLMGPVESTLATALVLALCAMQPGVGYVQPYAYAALYAFVLALGSLAATLHSVLEGRRRSLAWAGVLTGLALISKPEMAAASVAAAAMAIALASLRDRRPRLDHAAAFALPAMAFAGATWGAILLRVPWSTLRDENHVGFTNMPAQLYYFNLRVAGLADWPRSLGLAVYGIGGFALLAGVAGLIGGLRPAPVREARRRLLVRSAIVVGVALAWSMLGWVWLGFDNPPSPLHASSLLLAAAFGLAGRSVFRAWRERRPLPAVELTLLVVIPFASLCLVRTLLNVRPASPYAPFTVPVALLVLVQALVRTVPEALTPSEPLRRRVRGAALALVALAAACFAVQTASRARAQMSYQVDGPRGSFRTERKYGLPLAEAVDFVREHTSPGEYVLTLPEGTAINFLAARPYPLREEIVHPGFLEGEREQEAIRRAASLRPSLVLVLNRLMTEFRDPAFGKDYDREFMRWIDSRYHPVARFDSDLSRGAAFGDPPFFIVAYAPNP